MPTSNSFEGDNLDLPALTQAMAGCDRFHLAANADIRFGLNIRARI